MSLIYTGPKKLEKIAKKAYEIVKQDFERKPFRIRVGIPYSVDKTANPKRSFNSQEEINEYVDDNIRDFFEAAKQYGEDEPEQIDKLTLDLTEKMKKTTFNHELQEKHKYLLGTYNLSEDEVIISPFAVWRFSFAREGIIFYDMFLSIFTHEAAHFDIGECEYLVDRREGLSDLRESGLSEITERLKENGSKSKRLKLDFFNEALAFVYGYQRMEKAGIERPPIEKIANCEPDDLKIVTEMYDLLEQRVKESGMLSVLQQVKQALNISYAEGVSVLEVFTVSPIKK